MERILFKEEQKMSISEIIFDVALVLTALGIWAKMIVTLILANKLHDCWQADRAWKAYEKRLSEDESL